MKFLQNFTSIFQLNSSDGDTQPHLIPLFNWIFYSPDGQIVWDLVSFYKCCHELISPLKFTDIITNSLIRSIPPPYSTYNLRNVKLRPLYYSEKYRILLLILFPPHPIFHDSSSSPISSIWAFFRQITLKIFKLRIIMKRFPVFFSSIKQFLLTIHK